MVFGFDALVASLVLVLPGFIVVGIGVALAPAWERVKFNPAAFVLLSLGLSVPVHLAYVWLSSRSWIVQIRPFFRGFGTFDFTQVTALAFRPAFLAPLFVLLMLSVVIGLCGAALMRAWAWIRTRDGRGAPSQKTVWRKVFEVRKAIKQVSF